MHVQNVLIFILLFFLSISSYASPNVMTYQGRILKSDGTPLEYGGVAFIFQITDPSGQCVIYQEQVNAINMVNSGGVFDAPIGGGTVKYPLTGSFSILDAFNNNKTFTCGDCSGGSCVDAARNYNAVSGDHRILRTQFYDGAGWKTITPDSVIRSVPYAGYALAAEKLGTNVATDFLLKSIIPTCPSGTFLNWTGTTFTCGGVSGASGGTVTDVQSTNSYLTVVNGTSIPALTLNVGTAANTVAAGNDPRLSDARIPTGNAGGDLGGTYPNPSLTKIKGVNISITSLLSGEFLKYDGTNWVNSGLSTANLADGSNLIKTTQMPANCTAGQTLTFSSPSGAWVCSAITVADSQITWTSQTANKVFASPSGGTGAPTFRSLTVADLPANAYDASYFKNGGNSFGSTASVGTADNNSLSLVTNSVARLNVDTSGNVGIGTASPAAKIHTVDEGVGTWFVDNYSSTVGNNPAIIGRKAGGTAASPSAVLTDQLLFFAGGRGWDGTGFSSTSKASISMTANENWSTTNQGTRIVFSTTANGTTAAKERLRIDNTGYIGIGTAAPSTNLEVRGGLALSHQSIGSALFFKPEDQGGTYTNTADQRNFNLMPTAIGTDFGYKFSWRNADGSSRQDALTFVKDGSVSFPANVGIGTTTPVSKLHISSAPMTTANYPLFALGNAAFDGTTAGYFSGSVSGTVIGANLSSGYAGDFVNFQIAGASKFKIDKSGNITTSGNTSSSGNTTSTGDYTTSGNISTSGTGTISSAGQLIANSGTASTSPSTGALVVNGGAGVTGAMNVGGAINANSNLAVQAATAAVSGTNQNSPSIYLKANYWNGSASAVDQWSIQNILGAGTNPTSTLTFGHSGSSGSSSYALLNGNVGVGTTTPLSKLDVNGNMVVGTFAGTAAAPNNSLAVSGQIMTGQNAVQSGLYNSYTTSYNFNPRIQVSGTSADGSSLSLMQFQATNGSSANLVFAKSRSGTVGTQASVANGDELGILNFQGSDGTNFIQSSKISSVVTGTPATGDVASELRFATRAPAAASPTTRMVIDNSGNVGIGVANPSSLLHVSNNIAGNTGSMIGGTNYTNPASGNTTSTWGINVSNSYTQNGLDVTSGGMRGGEFSAANGSNALVTMLYGVIGVTNNSSTGTTQNAWSVYGSARNANTGTITNAYGGIFETQNLSTGTITNAYGVYVGSVAGTNKWAVYTSDTSPSYFKGNVGIGTTTPGQKLSVAGTIESTSGGMRYPDSTTQTTAYPGPAKRALVVLTAGTSATATTAIAWNSASYDTGSFWSAGSPTRLTVPAGVTLVRLCGGAYGYFSTGSGLIGSGIIKNGASGAGLPHNLTEGHTNSVPYILSVCSAPVVTTAGDYFEFTFGPNGAGTVTIPNDARTWFSIEEVR